MGINIRELFKTQIDDIFDNHFKTVKETVTYVHIIEGQYDPSQLKQVDVEEVHTIDGFFIKNFDKQRDYTPLEIDTITFLIREPLDFTPSTNDVIRFINSDGDNTEYVVYKVEELPKQLLYKLLLHKK